MKIRILIIFMSFESWHSALSNGAKIIKIRFFLRKLWTFWKKYFLLKNIEIFKNIENSLKIWVFSFFIAFLSFYIFVIFLKFYIFQKVHNFLRQNRILMIFAPFESAECQLSNDIKIIKIRVFIRKL